MNAPAKTSKLPIFQSPKDALLAIQTAQKLTEKSSAAVLRQCVLARRDFPLLKNHPQVIEAVANALHDLGHYARAASYFERVLEQFPASSRAHYNVGRSLLSAQRLLAANDCFAKAELLEPDYPLMLLGKGFIQLITQNYAQGWPLYEHRLRADGFVPREVKNVALWEGQATQPIQGKSIFVANEQGLGDTLMFFRYVLALAQLGASITVLVQPRLHAWVSQAAAAWGVLGSKGGKITAVVSDGDPVQKTDYWCPMPSLPAKLEAWKPLPPAMLQVAAAALPQAKAGVLKVGLAWSGEAANQRNAQRSFEFKHIATLLGTPNVQFFNLQMGDALKQAQKHLLWASVVDLTPAQTSFLDAAQHMAALDLIITVDTSILHAAGALNIPFWALLDSGAEWRNGTPNQQVHPFYPNSKLYRAPRRGLKTAAVAKMSRDLAAYASSFVKNNAPQTPAMPHGLAPHLAAPTHSKTQPLFSGSWLNVVRAKHGVFACNRHDTFVGRSLAQYGQVLEGEFALCSTLLAKHGVVAEVGAGVGVQTIALAKHLNQRGRVMAFEAQQSQLALLQTNVTLNELANVSLHYAVVGAQAGAMTVPQFNPLQPRNLGELNLKLPAAQGLTVPVLTLDELPTASLDLLKIDAPHWELDVLSGAAKHIQRFKPIIYLCNPQRQPGTAQGSDTPVLDVQWLPFLQVAGYRVFAHRVALFEANNFAGNVLNEFADKVSTNFVAFSVGAAFNGAIQKQFGLIEIQRFPK